MSEGQEAAVPVGNPPDPPTRAVEKRLTAGIAAACGPTVRREALQDSELREALCKFSKAQRVKRLTEIALSEDNKEAVNAIKVINHFEERLENKDKPQETSPDLIFAEFKGIIARYRAANQFIPPPEDEGEEENGETA